MKLSNYFFMFLAGLLISCQDTSKIDIVKNGTSDYKIIFPAGADSLVVRAAGELQKYIEATGKVRLPMISEGHAGSAKGIWVGNTEMMKTEEINEHQITYFLKSDQLVIAGGNSESTLNAVYTFLENELGCRFYSPDVDVIKESEIISINKMLKFSYEPAITTRTFHSRLFMESPSFAAKLKVSSAAFPHYMPTAEVHTFKRFMPGKKFFKTHPEYYALRDGKRNLSQLCLTNDDVFRIICDSLSSMILRKPDANVISVSQNDNSRYCQCDNCMAIDEREGSPSGSMIDFVNRVAAEFPEKVISTLAYQYTRKAPLNLKPAPNVMVVLCSIECDRSAPIAEKCPDFADDLIEWGKITNNIQIWDYNTQFTNFHGPFPNIYVLKPNILFFRDNHVKWIFEQHSYQPSELLELRSYLAAKLLWNPDIDVDSTIKDFLMGYYEEAGPYIWNYISTVNNEIKKDPEYVLSIYGDPSQAFSSYLKPELLSQYGTWYDEAEKSVSDKPEGLKRVKIARLSVDYAFLEAARANLSEEFSMAILQKDGTKKMPEGLKSLIQNFRNTCAEANIKSMNETGYPVEEYVDSYITTLERAQKQNLAFGKKVKLKEPASFYANEDPQVLTDGALGGGIFYAGWLGFKGNNMEAIIDLEQITEIQELSTAFLRVPVRYLPKNRIIFYPLSVQYFYSVDGNNFIEIEKLKDAKPLPESGKGEVQYFTSDFSPVMARYIKVIGENIKKAPAWHSGVGLPVWIFADEVEVQ